MKKINQKKEFSIFGQQGFTLVETLVAIAIFASSITALMSISARGINDNVFVKNKLTASYLAAEGVELVRNMRDNAALGSQSSYWTSSFLVSTSPNGVNYCFTPDTPGSTIKYCYIDTLDIPNPEAFPCPENGCPRLKYNNENGTYGYNSGQETNFVRTITVSPTAGNESKEVIVNSSVSWTQGNKTFTTSYQYNLFDWISIGF